MQKDKKVIIFDLDETIGSFTQLYKFWYLINIFFNKNIENKYFYNILDDNILFLRPNMINIFNNIKQKKINKLCSNVIIYTNNNGDYFWVELIKDYINNKIQYNVIDKIIRAYKIDNKPCEKCRTTYDKTLSDFFKCSKLPKNSKICFFDDKFHEHMIDDNVLYMNLTPYNYYIKYSELCKKFYNNNLLLFKQNNKTYKQFYDYIKKKTNENEIKKNLKTAVEYNIEKMVSNHIMRVINKFLRHTNYMNYTKKKKIYKNKTIKFY